MKARKLSADTLSFEVLESIAVANAAALQSLIAALQPVDCSFALSSFTGTPQGMDLIETLPISFVKIDGSLTRRLLSGAENDSHIKLIISRCHAAGIRTIAEQVEETGSIPILTKLGIDFAQGFAIARPAPILSD